MQSSRESGRRDEATVLPFGASRHAKTYVEGKPMSAPAATGALSTGDDAAALQPPLKRMQDGRGPRLLLLLCTLMLRRGVVEDDVGEGSRV